MLCRKLVCFSQSDYCDSRSLKSNTTCFVKKPSGSLGPVLLLSSVLSGVTVSYCKLIVQCLSTTRKLRRIPFKVRAILAKIILLKIYSQHGNFLNAI